MVQYIEQTTLSNRGPVDQGAEIDIAGSLLVGTDYALTYREDFTTYGHDTVYIFPAFVNGERGWLKRAVRDANFGYSASGTQETILTFDEGVKIFLEHETFKFPTPGPNVIEVQLI